MTEQWGAPVAPAPRKKRRWIKGAVIAIIILLTMFTCTAVVASMDPVITPLATGEPSPLPSWAQNLAQAPTKPADVSMESTCDYLLDFDDNLNGHHSFVASAFLSNDGGTSAVVTVTAQWRQAGGKPITASKKVTVPAGSTDVEVQITHTATTKQINKIQALDTDKMCTVKGQ